MFYTSLNTPFFIQLFFRFVQLCFRLGQVIFCTLIINELWN